MPSFSPAALPDSLLRQDYAALVERSSESPSTIEYGNEWSWSTAEVSAARTEGLELWRKPDPAGVACANCHTPDALDLAILGYTDDVITRRARLHLEADDAAKLVKFVHAQRRHFGIERPCHPEYRPLQPGGVVLPGDTPIAQDMAFGEQLQNRGYHIATMTVRSLQDAQTVFDEMITIDLRNLPIGIALPRWTEDGFNGPEHASMNDYMPPLGLRPNAENREAWYTLADDYIAQPTDENLYRLLERLEEFHNDGGYRAQHSAQIGNCRRYRQAGDYLYDLARRKRRSQFVVMHVMRQAVLQGHDTLPLPLAPLAGYTEGSNRGLNPFWSLAGEHAENICYDSTASGKAAAEAIIAAFPDDALAELPASDRNAGVLDALPAEIAHPWFTLGQVYDPALSMRQPDNATNKLNYWQILTFDHDAIHMPFFALHRLALQAHFVEDLMGTAAHPGPTHFLSGTVHPLLDGDRIWLRQVADQTFDGNDPRAGLTHRVAGNVFRAVLMRQVQLLEAGEGWTDGGQTRGISRFTDSVRRWADRLVNAVQDSSGDVIRAELGADIELYTTDLRLLADRVDVLRASVPDVDP